MGLDALEIHEMIQLLRANGDLEDLQSALSQPFETRTKDSLFQTRFSDGSIRVFYSAIELETAREEVKYHCLGYAITNSSSDRSVYYNQISCELDGKTIIDLRPHIANMPYLIKDKEDGYKDCNRIGREAKGMDLDGLLTPSARNQPSGSCAPIFKRSVIDNPLDEGVCEFFYDTTLKTVEVMPF
jgi:hypothetical protein